MPRPPFASTTACACAGLRQITQGIVFNAHYLAYADAAVTEYWRALGLPFGERIPTLFGGELLVRHAELSYHASARYDDWLDVKVRRVRLGRSSLALACQINAQGHHAVDVDLVYVFSDPALKQSQEIPAELRDWINAFEAGVTMTDIALGTWAHLQADARPLRTAVFIDEQRVPVEMEWDADDATAVHAVAYNRARQPIATARLLPAHAGVSKVGRMAVDASLRGSGVGQGVLMAMLACARERGDRSVALHAQVSARGFYERCGFMASGPVFDEAGIAHLLMSCVL